MVSRLIESNGDAVALRLSRAGDGATPSVIAWLEAQQERAIMRRRASSCTLAAWLLLVAASMVSFLVAFKLSRDARILFAETIDSQLVASPTLTIVPVLLCLFAAIIVFGGAFAWWGGWFPGWSRTASAIDWSSSSDAVARLLTVGCTYPEAFRLAAEVSRGKAIRSWLQSAADRVERGGQHVGQSTDSRGDTAMLEALVQTSRHEPARQWRIAATHFFELSARRLVVLLQIMPMISTIVSGLLIWVAVSSTLGWMWRGVAEMIRGLT